MEVMLKHFDYENKYRFSLMCKDTLYLVFLKFNFPNIKKAPLHKCREAIPKTDFILLD